MARRTESNNNVSTSGQRNKILLSLETPEIKWRTARILAMKAVPYYAPGVNALIYHEREGIGTMATDRWWRCYVDPNQVMIWVEAANEVSTEKPCESCGATKHHELAYIAGVIVHEANHLIRMHHKRMDAIHGMNLLANICCDMEENDDLMESFKLCHAKKSNIEQLCIPPTHLNIPHKHNLPNDNIAEYYYYELLKNMDKEELKSNKVCGSGATGIPMPWEMSNPKDPFSKDFGEMGISEEEANRIIQDVAKKIEDHASQGNVPQSLSRWAKGKLQPPRYDWRKPLRHAVGSALHMTYGFDTENTRDFNHDCAASDYDVIMPSTERPVPEVGVIRDTSGSMGEFTPGHGLYEASRELEGICKRANARVQLLDVACSADVRSIRDITSAANLEIKDGGGTDLRLGVEAFRLKKRNRPNIVIMLTDGFTPWPETKPKEFKLIVCLVGKYKEKKENCPKWATVIDIDEEGKN